MAIDMTRVWCKGPVGLGGAVVTSLCCLGAPVLVAAVAGLGMGFLLTDLVLLPLVVVFLVLMVYGSYQSRARHRKAYPLRLTAILAVVLIPTFFVSAVMAYVILLGLLGMVAIDAVLAWRQG